MTFVRPLIVLSLALLPTAPLDAVGAQRFSVTDLIAEKATIVMSPQGPDGDLEGYLVIWNGTTRNARLTGVGGPAFSRVRFVQTANFGESAQKVEQTSFSVPAHAELVMLQRGVHLHLQPGVSLAPGDVVTLDLAFDDGTNRTISATVEPNRDRIDLHYHDPSSLEWLRLLRDEGSQDSAG